MYSLKKTMPKLSYADLLTKCKLLQEEVEQYKVEIEELKKTNNELSIINSDNSVAKVDIDPNYFWVFDPNTKEKKGLDMNKVLSFGCENLDYVDSSRSLEHILKTVYCNDKHTENRVIHHMYLNEAWLVFKFKDHVLRYFIDSDTIYLIDKMIIGNIERRLGLSFKDSEMRLNAIRALVMQLGLEVRANKFGKTLPIWNNEQFKEYEVEDLNRYKTNYLSDMGIGTQHKKVDTTKWDQY